MSTPRVHILGLGNIGTFTAHVLAEAKPRPPITLLFHRPNRLNDFVQNGNCVSLHNDEAEVSQQFGYDVEVLRRGKWYHTAVVTKSRYSESSNQPVFVSRRQASNTIRYLVVAVKSWQTVSALASLKDRLNHQSTILFIQNGSGMIEAVNKEVFRSLQTRPKYMMGITTHCVKTLSQFDIEHVAFGNMSLGLIPYANSMHNYRHNRNSSQLFEEGFEDNYLMEALTSVPRMNAKVYNFTNLLQLQLEKLVIDTVNNPISFLTHTKEKYLWEVPHLLHDCLDEISAVTQKLPELQGVTDVEVRFSVASLEDMVLRYLTGNDAEICSTLQDLETYQKTEAEFINGYWVKKGRELGIFTPMNAELMKRIEEREETYL